MKAPTHLGRAIGFLMAAMLLVVAGVETTHAQQGAVETKVLPSGKTLKYERTAGAEDRALAYMNMNNLRVFTYNFGDFGSYALAAYLMPVQYPNKAGGWEGAQYSASLAVTIPPGFGQAKAQVHVSDGRWNGGSRMDWDALDGAAGTQWAVPPATYQGIPLMATSTIPATWPGGTWPAPEDVSDVWLGTETWMKWQRKADQEAYSWFSDYNAGENTYSTPVGLEVKKRMLAYSSIDAVFWQWEITNGGTYELTGLRVGVGGDLGGPVWGPGVGVPHWDDTRNMMYVVGANHNPTTGYHDDDAGNELPWFGYVYLESPSGSMKVDNTDTMVDNPGTVITRLSLTDYNLAPSDGGEDETLYGCYTGDLSYLSTTEARDMWVSETSPVYMQDENDFLSHLGPTDPYWFSASGEFDLAPGESIDYVMAMVGGPNELTMKETATQAIKSYQAQFSASGPPPAPVLGADGIEAGPHGKDFDGRIHNYPIIYSDSGEVTLHWDGRESEAAVDAITGNADFEGYRLYRSTDRGATWGEPVTDPEGERIGWVPIGQWDLDNDVEGPDPQLSGRHLGDNTGLVHTFTDEDVMDGMEYWYAITAYDYDPPTQTLESAMPTDPKSPAMVSVIAGARPAGYEPGALGTGATAGTSITLYEPTDPDKETTIGVDVLDDVAITGDSYEVQVADHFTDPTGTYSYWGGVQVRNTTTGTDLFEDPVLGTVAAKGGDNVPVTEGFRVATLQPNGGNAGVYQLTQTAEADPDTSYSGTEFYVAPEAYMQAEGPTSNRGNVTQVFSDFEMRFVDSWPYNPTSTDTNWCADVIMGDVIPCPFELWNLEENVRVYPVIYDYGIYNVLGYGSYYGNFGEWDGIDITVFTSVPYWEDEGAGIVTDFTGTVHPWSDSEYWDYDPSNPNSRSDWLYRWGFGEADGTYQLWDPGDVWQLETYKPLAHYAGESYAFSTTEHSITAEEADVDDVVVVPNPYYIFAEWDRSENTRKIQFRNVPPNSTVDIYTLSGELVASLAHDDEYNSTEIGTVDWNIWTYEYTEAAYGLYVYVVKTPDGQKKVGKFAIIR